MRHATDYSNKKQLKILACIILMLFAGFTYYVNVRTIRANQLPPVFDQQLKNSDTLFKVMNEIAQSVKELKVQLNHFPSAPLSIEDMSKVSSVFSTRKDPITGEKEFHTGIDYRAKRGSIVYAAAAGVITDAKYDDGYGNTVRIDHENGYKTTYAHLSNMTVVPGEVIKKGDTIGNVGATGKTTGSHLHYEISYNNKKINPEVFLQTITR